MKPVPRWRWVAVCVGIGIFTWLTGMAVFVGVLLSNGPAMEWFGVLVTGAWTMAVVGLVLGSFPRGWYHAALIVWILMMVAGLSLSFEDSSLALVVCTGVYGGGVLVLGSYAKRAGRGSWKWASLGTIVLCIYFVGRIWDIPPIPDDYEAHLGRLEDSEGAEVEGFYRYGLGGLVDIDELWRIDGATDEVVAQLKKKCGAQPVAELPERFFQMRPYYWPNEVPENGALFASPGFFDRRSVVDQCVALVDPEAERVYVWMKITL